MQHLGKACASQNKLELYCPCTLEISICFPYFCKSLGVYPSLITLSQRLGYSS